MISAVEASDLNTIEALFKGNPRSLRSRGGASLAPIHTAVLLNNLEVVQFMLALDSTLLEQRGGNDITVLHVIAGEKGKDQRQLVEYICLNAPFILNQADSLGRTAMYVALETKNRQVAATLHRMGYSGYHLKTAWGESSASLRSASPCATLGRTLGFCRSLTEILYFMLVLPPERKTWGGACAQQ